MWYEWLVRRCDMGALAAVSALQQQPPQLDQQGSDHLSSPSSAQTDASSPLNRRKAARRAPTPHTFPPSPTPGPVLLPSELVSPPSCAVWSPLFENLPACKDLGYQHAGAPAGGLKALSSSTLLGDQTEAGTWTPEQQALNQLARKYLQTAQELKPSSCCARSTSHSHSHDQTTSPTTSGQKKPPNSSTDTATPPSYEELKAGFWKRLAETRCAPKKDESSRFAGADPAAELDSASTRESSLSDRKRPTTAARQGSGRGSAGGFDRRLSSVEIEVVLSGKRNGDADEAPKPITAAAAESHCEAAAGRDNSDETHVPGTIPLACEDGKLHPEEYSGGISSAAVARDHDDDGEICRTGASSSETSDGEEARHDIAATNPCEKQEGSGLYNLVGIGGTTTGIGRGRIAEDGSPMSVEIHREPWGGGTPAGSFECNRRRKEEDGDMMLWNSANWCIVDSYITGHGKETTWTVRGFEKDEPGINFGENPPDCKGRSPLRVPQNGSDGGGLGARVEPGPAAAEAARHGPPPKWTPQALQERVAQNLRKGRPTDGGDHGGRHHAKKLAAEKVEGAAGRPPTVVEGGGNVVEGGGRCRDAMLDELMSIRNLLHCRMGGKLLKEAVLAETRDNDDDDFGDEAEESPEAANFTRSPSSVRESWKDVRRFSNITSVGPSTMTSDRDKDLPNMVSLREFRRRKRGWVKKRGQPPSAALACCASMIGDTVEAVRRTREDAAALAFKLAELHARDAKALRASAAVMCTHVDALHSEVQEFRAAWESTAAKYPWQHTLKNIVVAISLVSSALGLPRALNTLRRLLFGPVQSPTTRKDKMMAAVMILCSGSYFGKEIWQSLGRVQATRKAREARVREQLRLILERTSLMSTVAHKDLTVHQAQDDERGQLVVV